ncbi:MAG TPA: hypothetical protein VMM81_03700 [Acidimicrobiia bacterium]|nr:hypothetical protein [Acidimicrobiia bacterium]
MHTTTRRVGSVSGGTASRSVFLLVALSLVAGACSGDATPDTTAATGADTPTTASVDDERPPLDTGEPFGLEATVSLDEEGAVRSFVLSSEGATIEATGPDGTAYRLVIPPDALLADTLITMMPLTTVEGEFVDGLVGGVDLRPAGLQFRESATLEIVPVRDVPIEHQVPFAYEGDGSRVGFGHIQLGSDSIALWVPHFSGTGVLESTDARMEMNRRLEAHEAVGFNVAAQKVAAVVDSARASGADALTGADVAEIESIMHDYFVNQLRPRMEYAERLAESRNPGDLEYISGVVGVALGLLREAQLLGLGLSEEFEAEVMAWIGRIMEKAYRALHARCVEDHDFTVIPLLLGMLREQELLGASSDNALPFECLGFEIRYESEVTVIDDDGHAITFPTEARVAFNLAELLLGVDRGTFDAPLSYAEATWVDPDQGPWCSAVVEEVTDGTLEVLSGLFDWEPENMAGGRPKFRADGRSVPPDDVVLVYDIGEAILRQRTIDGDDCTWSVPMIETDTLRQAWRALHAATEVAPYWYADEWEMLFDGDLVARKVYERQVTFEHCHFDDLFCAENRAEERTTFELVHTPGT